MHFAYKAFMVAAMLFPAVPAWADEAADKAALAREAVELAVGPGPRRPDQPHGGRAGGAAAGRTSRRARGPSC